MGKQRGFTLIEVMATLVLVALCAAAVAWSFAPAADRALLTDVLDRLHQFDAAARHAARRSGQPMVMHFDLEAQQLHATIINDETAPQTKGPAAMRMPAGFHLTAVRTAANDAAFGEAAVPCSSQGCTPTYALRIETETTREEMWVVAPGAAVPGVAVPGGRFEVIRDPWDIDAIFDRLAGIDAR